MAKLSQYRRDAKSFQDGSWVRPNPDEDLEILTRGMGDAYADAQAAAQRRAAVGYGGDIEKLPVKIKRAININSLINNCLLDVRGLKGDDDKDVSFAEFCDLIRDPDYPALASAAFVAAGMVSTATAESVKAATGN